MSIGETLKELRKDTGKSQQEVADDLGISKSALGMYEKDHRIPKDKIKVRIADYFGKSVMDIFYANIAH